jgi:hypothetical protein
VQRQLAERWFMEVLRENLRERAPLGPIDPHATPQLAQVRVLAKLAARRMRRRMPDIREVAEPATGDERVDVVQAALLKRTPAEAGGRA